MGHFFARDRSHFGHQSQPWGPTTCHVSRQRMSKAAGQCVNLAVVVLHGVLKAKAAKVQTVWVHPAQHNTSLLHHNTTSSRCLSTFTLQWHCGAPHQTTTNPRPWSRGSAEFASCIFMHFSDLCTIYLYCTKHM